MNREDVVLDRQRHSVDPRNLSLFIHGITADEERWYLCILGVKNPQDNSELIFAVTQTTELTLSIFSKSSANACVWTRV